MRISRRADAAIIMKNIFHEASLYIMMSLIFLLASSHRSVQFRMTSPKAVTKLLTLKRLEIFNLEFLGCNIHITPGTHKYDLIE